jgi:replication factor C subunit 1
MTVCFKEKISIKPDLLEQIIVGCNYDIRQCLHNLSIWSSNNKSLVSNKQSQLEIEKAMKDIRMNPFEACKLVFSPDNPDKKQRTMMDKMDYFFADYSLMPLLVHENYLKVYPVNLKGNSKKEKDLHHLQLLSSSIESMCNSDAIGRLVRSGQNWSILPVQAIFATVVPGENIKGQMGIYELIFLFFKRQKLVI